LAIINAKIDDKLVRDFRHIIYERHGLRKGDFKNALEEAMLDYIHKYSLYHLEAAQGQKETIVSGTA